MEMYEVLQAILDERGANGYYADGHLVIRGGPVRRCFDSAGYSFLPGDRAYQVQLNMVSKQLEDGSEKIDGPIVYNVAIRGTKITRL